MIFFICKKLFYIYVWYCKAAASVYSLEGLKNPYALDTKSKKVGTLLLHTRALMKCKTKLRRGRTLILLHYRLPLRWIFLTYNAVDVGLVLSNFAEVCQNWWIINLLSSAETSDNIRVDHIFLKSIIPFMFKLTITFSLIQQPSERL